MHRVRLHDLPKPKRIRLHDQSVNKPTRKKAKANRTHLTQDKVDALAAKAKDYLVWDAGGRGAIPGLHVQVLPSGTKTYRYSFRFPGAAQATSYKLGRWPGMTLDEARERSQAAAKQVAKGRDPRKDDPTKSDTFGVLLERWHEREQVGRKANVSADATKKFVLHHCGELEHRPTATIRYEEIDDLLADIVKGGRPHAANRLHAHLASLFRWAVRSRKLVHSPMEGMLKPWEGARGRLRDWFAGEKADAVIKDLWKLANELGGDAERFLKLLILTGKRRTAIMTMRWEHIDKSMYWTPPKGSKNKRCTPIPLPKLAQRILGQRCDRGPVMHVTDTMVQRLAAVIRERLELPDFILHGVRHVVETKLGELKVPPHIRDLLLDHAIARAASGRGYDHGLYKDELLAALETFADFVEDLVSPGKGVAVLR